MFDTEIRKSVRKLIDGDLINMIQWFVVQKLFEDNYTVIGIDTD